MDRSTPIVLIAQEYSKDQYGVLKPTQTRRQVFASVNSVTATEFFEGGRNGLNPELRFTMFAPDYNGEDIVEYNGNMYAVYRTYLARTDILELYTERREGVR